MDFHIEAYFVKQYSQSGVIYARAGGVGYYPRSNFAHIDTGPVRHW
ncbi:DUF882 domain-containing protein [Klebsiella pneumoniae]|nr:DUF882 domain-containing protein [Klebsiella pneumoniae]